MKIDIYTLLGLIKDGKAPKKIKYKELIIEYDEELFDYWCENLFTDTGYLLKGIFATDKNHLNDEVEILDEEDEFIDIKPLVLKTFERTGEAVTIDRFEDYSFDNFISIEDTLAKVILNQKKIINKLKEEGK